MFHPASTSIIPILHFMFTCRNVHRLLCATEGVEHRTRAVYDVLLYIVSTWFCGIQPAELVPKFRYFNEGNGVSVSLYA